MLNIQLTAWDHVYSLQYYLLANVHLWQYTKPHKPHYALPHHPLINTNY